MSKKTNKVVYEEGTLGKLQVVEDFLPAPEDLVLKKDNTKVTLNLSTRSVEFFKKEAKKQGVKYQTMIRNLVDQYAMKSR